MKLTIYVEKQALTESANFCYGEGSSIVRKARLGLNKTDLVDVIAHELGTTKRVAETVVNVFMHTVVSEVARGEKVTLVGFGTFDSSHRDARTGRNPKTNEPLKIAAKRVARFKAGKDFAEAVDKKSK